MVAIHIKNLNPIAFLRDNYKVLTGHAMQYHMVTIGHTHTHVRSNDSDIVHAILYMNI